MAHLYAISKRPLSLYKDRRADSRIDTEERERILGETTTLYVGNLSFYTSEEQIFELFSKVGEIKRIIMGLDRNKKTPCGFCFVEYFKHEDAVKSVQFLCDTKLDERTIRVDYDYGFVEGRQYGRGKSGGQVRDEHRVDYDPGRGGFGSSKRSQMSANEMWGSSSTTSDPQQQHHFNPNSNHHHHHNQHPQHQPPYMQPPPPHHFQQQDPFHPMNNQHMYNNRRGPYGSGRGAPPGPRGRGRGAFYNGAMGPPPMNMPPPPAGGGRYFHPGNDLPHMSTSGKRSRDDFSYPPPGGDHNQNMMPMSSKRPRAEGE